MTRLEYLDIETINTEEGIRQIIDTKPLDELVTSIKQHGILQPIVVARARTRFECLSIKAMDMKGV